jgi:HlyD family secretion protein
MLNMKLKIISSLILAAVLGSCGNGNSPFDATGNFEATEIIVAAEASGRIMELNIEEGQSMKAGQVIGWIDTTQLALKRQQLQFSISAVMARQPDVKVQLAAIREQIATATREKARVERLLKSDAATPKQLDDLNAQIDLFQRQLAATQSSLDVTTRSLRSETFPLRAQLDQIKDQLKKSVVINPIDGIVLTTFALKDEVVGMAKPLYKIGEVSKLKLRAYVSGSQLSGIKLGQQVKVHVDDGADAYKTYPGVISWISEKAEFTPKTIQTKDERANLVYPIKILVDNKDGLIKIGMYGEVEF